MNEEVKSVAREKIGTHLKSIRESKNITTYQITKSHGIRFEIIKSIENGSSNYTIDSFLSYIAAIDCYFFLADRAGEHLNEEEMVGRFKQKGPEQ